ncbi:Pentatricopeptide repeat-containing protein [Acorus gramineus]|uniref:Pentatricopeptide repeat-containing protein n=1 Tax=Acorus gramineus TaxID=55184 RepID=A0AAV9BK08_ACOGR|nr:Pentatricopeptide repeat-containing protein [Acorus gramineus]
MVSAYAKNGRLEEARAVFDAMPERDVASWNAMLTGYCHTSLMPSFVAVVSALTGLGDVKLLESLRTLAIKTGCESHVVLGTATLNAYTRMGELDFTNGRVHEARSLFDGMPVPGIVSWNAMIAGYAQNGMMGNAMGLFERMPRRNSVSCHSCFTSALFACANSGAREMGRQMHALAIKAGAANDNPYIGNGLITMYANCGDDEEEARATFERMPRRDIVSWTSMISAYVQAGTGFEAFQLFQRMLRSGVEPNAPAIMSILSFCSNFGATKLGLQVHSLVFRLGLDSDVFVGNALVGMYFRCGCVDSFKVFDEMDERDIVTWNSMLSGCAHNGLGREAIDVFESMKSAGVTPNEASFTGLLGACSHAGLVDEGWRCFKLMESELGLVPSLGHYACIVDLLGRAGHLYEAEAFVENMPIEPDSIVWAALLGACRVHSDAELGRRVAERLFEMEPEKPGNYILLSNIYASKGMFEEVAEVRRLMRARGVMKDPGCSTSASSGTRLSIRRRESVTGSSKCG